MGNTEQFEPGDVVCLKSGGPPMTVENIGREGEVRACFFGLDAAGGWKFERHSFVSLLLRKASIGIEARSAAVARVAALFMSNPSVRDQADWHGMIVDAALGVGV